jgi:predicted RNase H-like HicB family nuclease
MGEVTLKLHLVMERDGDWIVLSVPELPGCVSQGRTELEADRNIREAILASWETRRAHGLPSVMPFDQDARHPLREIFVEVPA